MNTWNDGPVFDLTSIVNRNQLHTLGISDNYLYILLGFVSILICFWLIRPLVRFMVLLNWEDLITYLIGGVMLFSSLLLIVYSDGNEEKGQGDQLSYLVLGFVLFGGCLCSLKVIKTMAKNMKKNIGS
ncbi:hypothetical protein ERJ70_08030 [Sediminibacillus dalangtanensis]|uniref:Uncharacterized protein n=1 Tax=Sediminibacillus dalangtanensis TaxID=2729421 RepID=A0ABX7VQW4_9BACI|nr:hypothetical protein [Sediminibacillus dalangtanensis]QTM99254.1 hypothetical protein ERJ70_08030 [Sediminibacillus dalangtanensis]